ncbi:MFS transporter [Streptomyces violens]|uniref:MFS transporter n=1 Tax=Streptomyces violens TaxID=66377 RepID=UPI0007C82DBD
MLTTMLPPPGPPRTLALAQLVARVGDGLYYVCAALYFTRVVGLSPAEFGVGLSVAWTLGMVVGVPLGHVADRKGPRGTAVLLFAVAGLATGSYLFIHSLPLFILTACVYAICQHGGSAAQQALMAGLVDKERITETRAYMKATYNTGLSIGAAFGGLALVFDNRAAYMTAFAANALLFFASSFVLGRLPAVPPAAAEEGEPRLAVLRDRPYAVITLLNLILVLHGPLIDVALPLWIVQYTTAPKWLVSAMFVLNTVSVVLLQVRVARGVTDLAGATRFVLRSGFFMLAACAVFALSAAGDSAWLAGAVMLVAYALLTWGEMMQSAGTWEISFGLAPPGKYGQYQGFFGIGMTGAEILGPIVLTFLIIYGGPLGWLVLGAALLIASVAMAPAVRWAERTRKPEPEPSDEPPVAADRPAGPAASDVPASG